MWETWVWFLSWKDPLEKGKAIHSSILVWRIPRTICPQGHKESGTNEWLSLHTICINTSRLKFAISIFFFMLFPIFIILPFFACLLFVCFVLLLCFPVSYLNNFLGLHFDLFVVLLSTLLCTVYLMVDLCIAIYISVVLQSVSINIISQKPHFHLFFFSHFHLDPSWVSDGIVDWIFLMPQRQVYMWTPNPVWLSFKVESIRKN